MFLLSNIIILPEIERFLTRLDVGGSCPSSTQGAYGPGCACGDGCTWQNCTWDNPPDDCLVDVKGADWKWNQQLRCYQAFVQLPGKILN